MPLNAEAETLLALIESQGAPPFETSTPEEAREFRRALAPPVLEPCHSTVDVDAGGVPARLYRPGPDAADRGLLVWLHGGGWVLGDLASHDALCHSLARRSGHAVLSVAYRLAPEDPFPAGLDDCMTATRWAHASSDTLGVDPARIAVGGDSAGANLAIVVTHLQPAPIAFQVLVYPVTDARANTASYSENGDGYFLTRAGMLWFIDHYLSGDEGAVDDPRVSPLLAGDDLVAASPPALVVTAGFDPLRDEGIAYAERLAELDVPTAHAHFPGQIHGFVSLAHMLAEGRSAVALIAQAVSDALAPSPAIV